MTSSRNINYWGPPIPEPLQSEIPSPYGSVNYNPRHSNESLTSSSHLMTYESLTKRLQEVTQLNRQEDITPAITISPDGGYGWVILFGSFCLLLCYGMLVFLSGMLVFPMSRDLNVPIKEVATISSVTVAFFYFTGPLLAGVVNSYGFRKAGFTGLFILCCGLFSSSFATSYYELYITYGILVGVGTNAIFTIAVIAVNFYFTKLRALVTGISSMGFGIGLTILPFVLNIMRMNDVTRWRMPLRYFAGLAFVLCFGPLLAMKPLKATVVLTPADGKRRTIGDGSTRASQTRTIRFGGINKDFETAMEFKEQNDAIVRRLSVESGIQVSSQPLFKRIQAKLKSLLCCFGIKTTQEEFESELRARPLYRDDIFYEGDVQRLPEFVSAGAQEFVSAGAQEFVSAGAQTEDRSFLYQLRVFRVALQRDLQAQCCDCCRGGNLVPDAICRASRSMIDCSFMLSPAFLLMGFGYGLFWCGTNIFTSLVFAHLRKHGFRREMIYYLVSSMGIANTVGRGVAGLMCYFNFFDSWGLVTISMFLTSLAILNIEVCKEEWEIILTGFFYGFATAPPTALATLLVVDLFGLHNLTGVYGLRQIFCGLGTLVGVPFAGFMNSYFNDDVWATRVGGTAVFIGAFLLFLIRYCKNIKVNILHY